MAGPGWAGLGFRHSAFAEPRATNHEPRATKGASGIVPLNLNSSVDFSRRDAEAQRMLDICVILPLRPKQNSITNLHLLGEKQQCASKASKLL